MGTCPTKRHFHIIDFGLSKQYRDPETNIHISFRDGLPLIGTARYASVNALMGVELSRRDDIESLSYILIYLMRGSLPWQGTNGEKRQVYVCEKKLSVNPDVLCDGLPIAFKKCLQYARSLKFSERPDYQYLRGLFTDLRRQLVHHDSEFLSLGTTFSQLVTLPTTGSDSTKTQTLPNKKCRVRGVKR
jgi:serine/threonine protein kinase